MSYTELGYIESTGQQYINTGVIPNANTRVELKCVFREVDSQSVYMVLTGDNYGLPWVDKTYNCFNWGWLGFGGPSIENPIKNKVYVFEAFAESVPVVVINGNRYEGTSITPFSSSVPMHLFAFGGAPTNTTLSAKAAVYYCKMWDGSELVRDYIPVLDESGVACLYDKVSSVYFYNKGTGEFVAGPLKSNNTHEFGYTGATEEFIVPCTGRYKLEAWGAQGGSYASYRGGYGGYSVGFANLSEGDKLYIAVGGEGSYAATKGTAAGGFNGGGMCRNATIYCCGAGGGATHIAKSPGLLESLENNLDSILLVAGGGAGCFYYNGFSMQSYGNSGGGYHGGYSYDPKMAGTQDSGYTFGKADTDGDELNSSTNFAGGGGGFYGGYSRWGEAGAGGGSGYIGNEQILEAYMVGWSVPESVEKSTLTKNTSNYSNIPTSDQAKVGNGYVRITLWTANKYLLRSASTLYTVTDGTLSALTETEVTASLFQTYGVDEIPDGALLVGLTDPEVLYWQDSTDELPTLSMTVKGTPPLPQVFTSEPMDLTHESIAGIDHAAVDSSEDVRFAISFDDGSTWQAFDGSAWFDVSDTAPGMLASTMNAITEEQWEEVAQLTAYRLRFWLPNVTAFVKSVVIHYINP